MKAIVQDIYGPPSVLRVESIDRPAVGPNELLVEVVASPITYGDRRLRAADFPGISWLPGRLMMGLLRPKNRVPGTNFAGRVAEIGAAVTRFAVGDVVFGTVNNGGHAEYVAVPEDGIIAPMPAGFGFTEATALPYGALTALAFMRDYGRVQPGERVLIIGAAGEVGRYAVQIAAHLGAEVTAVCRGSDAELVRSLGARHVIDYRTDDFTQRDEQYDVIFDTPDVSSFRRCRRALRPKGRYLSLHVSLGVLAAAALTSLFGSRRAVFNVALGSPADLETVRQLAERGVIRPTIRQTLPMAQVVEAHSQAGADGTPGTVVMTFAAEPELRVVRAAS